MRPGVRLLGIALLALLLVGMGSHYAVSYEDHWPYPTNDALYDEYDRHVGERAFVSGTVQETDPSNRTARIRFEATDGPVTLTVEGVDASVSPGGVLQVYGTLRDDRRISAANVVVVNPAGSSKAFKYGVSLVGALLVVVLFFRHWRVDTDEMGFEVK